jgi:hypothetical protein
MTGLPSAPTALRAPLIGCAIALATTAALAITTAQLRRGAEDTHAALTRQLSGIQRQHEDALRETADIRLALRQHAELQQLGLTSQLPRLQLMSRIDAALATAGLTDLQYTTPPPRPLGEALQLTLSPIQLKGGIPHEARLLTLLSQLNAVENGLFIPLRCTLTHIDTDAPTIVTIDCEAGWLGVQTPI